MNNCDEMVEKIIELEKKQQKKKMSSLASSGFGGNAAKIDSDIVNEIINMLEEEEINDN